MVVWVARVLLCSWIDFAPAHEAMSPEQLGHQAFGVSVLFYFLPENLGA